MMTSTIYNDDMPYEKKYKVFFHCFSELGVSVNLSLYMTESRGFLLRILEDCKTKGQDSMCNNTTCFQF